MGECKTHDSLYMRKNGENIVKHREQKVLCYGESTYEKRFCVI